MSCASFGLCRSDSPQQCECVMWDCDCVLSLPACSRVWVIIPVCWQSRRTVGSAYADLHPLHLNCHLKYAKWEREKNPIQNVKTQFSINMWIKSSTTNRRWTGADLLTLIWRSYRDSLCCELIIKVARVCLWCYLGLKWWNKLRRRRKSQILDSNLHLSIIQFQKSNLFVLGMHIWRTVHLTGITLGMCVVTGPRKCSAEFGTFWIRLILIKAQLTGSQHSDSPGLRTESSFTDFGLTGEQLFVHKRWRGFRVLQSSSRSLATSPRLRFPLKTHEISNGYAWRPYYSGISELLKQRSLEMLLARVHLSLEGQKLKCWETMT